MLAIVTSNAFSSAANGREIRLYFSYWSSALTGMERGEGQYKYS